MTGSRTQSGPAPTYLRITLGEGTPTPTQSHQADRPASADSMHRAGPASRPFVLATLRALRLDPGPNPVLSTRSPKTSKTTAQQPLDTPRPFRDDTPRPFTDDSALPRAGPIPRHVHRRRTRRPPSTPRATAPARASRSPPASSSKHAAATTCPATPTDSAPMLTKTEIATILGVHASTV